MSIPKTLTSEKYTYILQKPIGKGSFGEVWKALMKPIDPSVTTPGIEVALKIVKINPDGSNFEMLLREAQNMKSISQHPSCSPYVVCLYDVFVLQDKYKIIFAMELATAGDMFQYIELKRDSGRPPMTGRRGMFQGIAYNELIRHFSHLLQGLVVLKENGIVHLDIKPDNFFGFKGSNGTITFKYGDFGLSCLLRKKDECMYGGTAIYMSVEYAIATLLATNLERSDTETLYEDVYSLGATFFELANLYTYIDLKRIMNELTLAYPPFKNIAWWRMVQIAVIVGLINDDTEPVRNPHSHINNLIENMTRRSIPTFTTQDYRYFWNFVDEKARETSSTFIGLRSSIPSPEKLKWYPGQPPFRFNVNQSSEYVHQESTKCTLGITDVDRDDIRKISRTLGIPITNYSGKVEMCLALKPRTCLINSMVFSSSQLNTLAQFLKVEIPSGSSNEYICSKIATMIKNQLDNIRTYTITLIINAVIELSTQDESNRLKSITEYLKKLGYIKDIGLIDEGGLKTFMDNWLRTGENSLVPVDSRIKNMETALTLSLLLKQWNISVSERYSVDTIKEQLTNLKELKESQPV